MKQFDLQEYLKNPQKKIVTRDGERARIICTDRNPNYPIVALVGEKTIVNCYTIKGRYFGNKVPNSRDLFFASEKKEGWIKVYHGKSRDNTFVCNRIFATKEEAEKQKKDNVVATIKIEWEE